jgi:hypothetical protein
MTLPSLPIIGCLWLERDGAQGATLEELVWMDRVLAFTFYC